LPATGFRPPHPVIASAVNKNNAKLILHWAAFPVEKSAVQLKRKPSSNLSAARRASSPASRPPA
jgi:hypothetical protein